MFYDLYLVYAFFLYLFTLFFKGTSFLQVKLPQSVLYSHQSCSFPLIDPITLGTSPVNYRVDSFTLFSLWPLNSAPISHGQSWPPTSAVWQLLSHQLGEHQLSALPPCLTSTCFFSVSGSHALRGSVPGTQPPGRVTWSLRGWTVLATADTVWEPTTLHHCAWGSG